MGAIASCFRRSPPPPSGPGWIMNSDQTMMVVAIRESVYLATTARVPPAGDDKVIVITPDHGAISGLRWHVDKPNKLVVRQMLMWWFITIDSDALARGELSATVDSYIKAVDLEKNASDRAKVVRDAYGIPYGGKMTRNDY